MIIIKKFFLTGIAVLLLSSMSLCAQVTIGKDQSPNPDAALELVSPGNNKGFLPPRIALVSPSNPAPLAAHVEGMVVYNTTVLQDSLQAGLYVNDGVRWIALKQAPYLTPTWFYMPSIAFNTENQGTGFTRDLYQEFKDQLNSSGALVESSAGAPAMALSSIPAASALYYYVTAYDPAVFANISITATGVMTYDIVGAASDSTYINIVFVEK